MHKDALEKNIASTDIKRRAFLDEFARLVSLFRRVFRDQKWVPCSQNNILNLCL
jgi:hypothetical protein